MPTAMGSVVAPDASAPASQDTSRYEELVGHCGIAVLAIVVFDVYQFCNVDHFLYRGTPAYTVLNSLDAVVPWLFVIGAFFAYEPIARAAIEGRPLSLRLLMTRRAVRLLPLYYFAIGVVWFPRQQSLPGDWRDLLEHLTFTQVFDPKRIFYTIGPAWAVSVVVCFSLLLIALGPVLTNVCGRLRTRRARVVVLTGSALALAVIALAWKAWSFSVGDKSTTTSFTTWFGPVANLDIFAVGMVVAVVAAATRDAPGPGRLGRASLRLVALAVLVGAFVTRRADTWSGVFFFSVCAVGFGCLVSASVLGSPSDRWAQVFTRRPLLWLGAISYSVYLWHEPIMLALRGRGGLVRQTPSAFRTDVAVVVVASVLVGCVSYWFIERHTRQLAEVIGGARSRSLPAVDRADL